MPIPSPLGQIKKVTVRDIFRDEARHFTPWLAKPENLALLSEEIGVSIELLEVEADVGRFNVDIPGSMLRLVSLTPTSP